MIKVLVTGATGNIGTEVIRYLSALDSDIDVVAAVRDLNGGKDDLREFAGLTFRKFDFTKPFTFPGALAEIDIVFLLRPPQISAIDKIIRPFLRSVRDTGIHKIVFLSVQGAEKSGVIPHKKIEKAIELLGFEYIFVRPSYFMQNLTTTLLPEIERSRTITLPAGGATFNWVDVRNIGECCATLINDFDVYANQVIEITGSENRSFREVAKLMSTILGTRITFKNKNPISFMIGKASGGMSFGRAMVLTVVHFVSRFQEEPNISLAVKELTGNDPTTLQEFLQREKRKFLVSQRE
ncbi:NmrA family NAD(P)-binding protein [Neolewinella antarctica]|uniref:Uncharacterized protein YbjT (DUF2867 family) n=1 Tax=Neolewinella antarctica TaxID=442734 RepID=A0ABX0X8K6_9BACT|nr:NmrA family NAD(P)-binding protein [Neolewinella antarctica]NJC25591.1 uncharacterized protein YbjT (DUF2867 family) [Neolewinella antarctica]